VNDERTGAGVRTNAEANQQVNRESFHATRFVRTTLPAR
jgi:hypothetical protein